MAKKAAAPEKPQNVNDVLNEELAAKKLTNLVKLAEDLSDMAVTCVSTGLPQFDEILHKDKKGFPLGRDVEFFSKKPESGKTSLAMQIGSSFQHQGLRVAGADVERTMTDELFGIHKIVTDPFFDPNIYALRLMRNEDFNISAEEFLTGVKDMSGMFDLLVVDSVAAMEKRANLDKEVDEENQMGGCSKLLSEFFRGNITKRAGILWINQTRSKMGGRPMPGQGEQFVRPGGKALEFYASIILELTMIEKMKVGDNAPFGMKIKAYTEKNKISPQWRSANLTYLFHKGFSSEWDYLELAEKAKVVEKSGSWFSFKGERVGQGMLNCVTFLEQNPAMFTAIKAAVDGEDVAAKEVEALSQDPPEPLEYVQDELAAMLKDQPQLAPELRA